MSSPTSPTSPPMSSGISLGLTRITTLLSSLRSPHLQTAIVHISGTNGKGSVSAYLSSILLSSKLSVGRFNSPHLVDEWDCLQINGKTIERSLYETTKEEVERVNEEGKIGATSFEILTATAFSIFGKTRPKLDLAIVEVGMGGRTDATNVVDSERTLLSVITSIELDHQKFLGDTIGEIARVKAGIIKTKGEVVVAKQDHEEVAEVIKEVGVEMDATIHFAGEGTIIPNSTSIPSTSASSATPLSPLVSLPLTPLRTFPTSSSPTPSPTPLQVRLPLPGAYQLSNAAAASLAAQTLRSSPSILSKLPSLSQITNDSIQIGIEQTKWPGRLDWLSLRLKISLKKDTPISVLVDGAHNPSSANHLASYLSSLPPTQSPTTLIIALSFPRQPISILSPLLLPQSGLSSRISKVICVGFTEPPSMSWIKPTSPNDIAKAVRELKIEGMEVSEMKNVGEALESLEEGEKAVVAGSLYLAADVYRFERGDRL